MPRIIAEGFRSVKPAFRHCLSNIILQIPRKVRIFWLMVYNKKGIPADTLLAYAYLKGLAPGSVVSNLTRWVLGFSASGQNPETPKSNSSVLPYPCF